MVVVALRVCLAIRNLLVELSLQLLLCHSLGLELVLLFLEVVFHLILVQLYVIVQFSSFYSPAIVTQSAHLGREGVHSLHFHTFITVEGICLDIYDAIEYVSKDYSTVNDLNSLNFRTFSLDCLLKELFLLIVGSIFSFLSIFAPLLLHDARTPRTATSDIAKIKRFITLIIKLNTEGQMSTSVP